MHFVQRDLINTGGESELHRSGQLPVNRMMGRASRGRARWGEKRGRGVERRDDCARAYAVAAHAADCGPSGRCTAKGDTARGPTAGRGATRSAWGSGLGPSNSILLLKKSNSSPVSMLYEISSKQRRLPVPHGSGNGRSASCSSQEQACQLADARCSLCEVYRTLVDENHAVPTSLNFAGNAGTAVGVVLPSTFRFSKSDSSFSVSEQSHIFFRTMSAGRGR